MNLERISVLSCLHLIKKYVYDMKNVVSTWLMCFKMNFGLSSLEHIFNLADHRVLLI